MLDLFNVCNNQGLGHQTWHELVDPKQVYNLAKLEKRCLNSVNDNILSNQETCQYLPQICVNMCESQK